jgi:hypothetical protein
MAKGGTIEIEVELEGAQDIKEGLGSIGTAGKALAANMGVANEKLGEGLENVGESVFGVVDSFAELKAGIGAASGAGIKGFTALLGPIGMVVTAGFTLYETFKLISGAAQEAEQDQAAMAAAASDLQSKLEALNEKGVIPSQQEMEKFTMATIEAQFAKEKLQGRHEKLTKVVRKSYQATQNLREATENLVETEKEGLGIELILDAAARQYNNALQEQKEAKEALRLEIKKYLGEQKALAAAIREGAKEEKALEEQSAESLKAKNKELIGKQKALKLMQAEIDLSEDQFKIKKVEIEQAAQLALLKVDENEENQKALASQKKALDASIKTFQQESLLRKKAAKDQDSIRKEIRKKRQQEAAQRKAARDRAKRDAELLAKSEQAAALKVFAEKSLITQLEIEAQEDSTQKEINLATHRYVTQLQLAKDNLNQQKIAILQFNAELKRIRDKETQEEIARVKQAQALKMNAARFNAQQIKNGLNRELELLRLNYDEKVTQADGNEAQITELTRQYGIDRQKLMSSQAEHMKAVFSDMFVSLGRGMASAAYNAIFFSDSLKEATANIIRGLGEQAAVESLMQTAKGFAALANPFTAFQAPGFFKSAAIFAGAATIAGATSAAMGAGGGGGGGGGMGGGGASAMGSPQTAQVPQREEATSSSMTFNINFSGAVVYDTRKAAEMALADRVTRAMNTQRRGAPRSRRS